MARHGENIRKRKDGRWEGRCLLYNKEKGKQRYRSVYGRTYEEAREKLAVLRNRQKESAKLADGKVPYQLTWSCYEGKDRPCGVCGTCIDRAEAFRLNGVKDPLDGMED